MRISDVTVEKLLRATGTLSDEQLQSLREQEKTSNKPLQDIAIESGLISEKQLTKLYAAEIGVSYIEINPRKLSHKALRQIPEQTARQYKAISVNVDRDGTRLLALDDPNDSQAVDFLRKQLGTNIKLHIAPASVIESALNQYRGNISSELTTFIANELSHDVDNDELTEHDITGDSLVAETVKLIIEYGITAGASDVHIEPRSCYVVIRYRIDGMLREANKLPLNMLSAVVTHLKTLSHLNTTQRRTPQDGSFKVEVSGLVYALRVSTLPVADGEKAVIRIVNESTKPATLEELGLWGNGLRTLQQAIIQPSGMVLVTGPAGAGISTTLFSLLSLVNSPSLNISTLEDPVEYRLFGVNQVQINQLSGITYASGLRGLLRQDPNIIMLGALPDSETAQLAVQTALSGRFIFSSLHTSDAASGLTCLIHMGIEPFLIASAVRAVISQRLVRRLCVDCRQSYTADNSLMKKLNAAFHLDKSATMSYVHELEKQAAEAGIGTAASAVAATSPAAAAIASTASKELASSEHTIKHLWKAHPDGCENCNHSGYRGRLGIYEVLSNDADMQQTLVAHSSNDHIQKAAIASGMVPMRLDGLVKALRGQTTIEEVIRVIAP